MNMALNKLERSCETPDGWRLATVEEAKENLEWIKQSNLLEEWDTARLLNGWIGGFAYDFQVEEACRSCVGYMLVIRSTNPEIMSRDDRKGVLYSEVPELSREGTSAAVLLCMEDWNEEVLSWLVTPGEDHAAIWEADDTKAASKLLSIIAREWQRHVRTHTKKTVRGAEFSVASLKVLRADILELYNDFAVDIKESLNDHVINNQNSEQGKITNDIFASWLREIPKFCDYLGLRESLEMFENNRFDSCVPRTWDVIAERVFYYAETFLISFYCSRLYDRLVMRSKPDLFEQLGGRAEPNFRIRNRMDDCPRVVFLLDAFYDFFRLPGLYSGAEKRQRARKVDTESDFQRFAKILGDQGFSIFSSKGKSDVFSTVVVSAAAKGDINLVKLAIKCAVHPSEIDGKATTALHRAAGLKDESTALEIAKMLLREDKSLAHAVENYMKSTPLHEAAMQCNAEMCKLLLKYGAIVTPRNGNGMTPLHLAVLDNSGKVARVLISAVELKPSVDPDPALEDDESNAGMSTPVDLAIERNTAVITVALLLSVSHQPQSYFKKLNHPLVLYLRESSRLGLNNLVQMLLDEGADPFEGDDEGKTALHYAAEGEDHNMAEETIRGLLFDKNGGGINWDKASVADNYGRNVLHLAAFLGNRQLCRSLLEGYRNILDAKDRDGQSAVYYAAAGPLDDLEVLEIILETTSTSKRTLVRNFSQTTPLHLAAARGKIITVKFLLSKISEQEHKKHYVGAADVLGQTALHKAASGGHVEVVKKLLEEGADPLKERDSDGKTALHCAAQADGEDAVKIAELLLNKCEKEERSLLLFAFASEIGLYSNSSLEKYLEGEKRKIQENIGEKNLLRVAARLGNTDMVREFITRGGDIDFIRDGKWIDSLPSQLERKKVRDVVDQIKNIVEQRSDKPAMQDHLGRNPFAIGLAALYLNPFVKSPVTVGISGEWGMGKSSVMVQTERILLKKAAQLAFTSSFQRNDIIGANASTLSVNGRARHRKMANAIEQLDPQRCTLLSIIDDIRMSVKRVMNFTTEISKIIFKKKERELFLNKAGKGTDGHILSGSHKVWSSLQAQWEECAPLTRENKIKFDNIFEKKYQPRYHQILKSLAVIDRRDMAFESAMWHLNTSTKLSSRELGLLHFEEEKSGISGKQIFGEVQGTTPSVLTVQYNAWHYKNETEAWAGLAVKVTEEFEATMTVAHKLRTSWMYNWTNRRDSICLKVIFPFFIQLVAAIFLSIIVWLVFGTAHNKDIKKLKYGGVPASMTVAAWGLGKSVVSFVKPISSQVVDYICLPDHSQKLGYHQQVIKDINFLKEQLCYKPTWIWKAFAFMWCCITWRWYENYVPGTKIHKMPPAFGDNLRIIVFVDDLDRCEENVILQVLSAVNLVLATCHINVIMSMENNMIQRAIVRKYGDANSNANNKSNEELTDKYLRKIVQLPLHLPDPSDKESNEFLQCQLGMWGNSPKRSSSLPAGTQEWNAFNHRNENPKFQIGSSTIKRPKPVRGEAKKDSTEDGAKEQKHPSVSDAHTAQQGSEQMEQKQPAEKAKRPAFPITKIFNSFCALPCLRKVQPNNETAKEDEQSAAQGFEVEDAMIEIQDAVNNEQSSRRDVEAADGHMAQQELQQMELKETTKKKERMSLITQILSYFYALPCFRNVQSHEETAKGDEQGDKEQESLSLLISTTVIPNYTPGERNAFDFLHKRSSRSRKLPREWKSFMAYHRLAWNIMYLTFHLKYIDPVEGWQVQLIAWIFVCWEWRDLMTTLIQKWEKLKVLRNWKSTPQGPSLREIVELYIEEKWPAEKKNVIKDDDDAISNLSNRKGEEKTSDKLPEENMTTILNEDGEGDDCLKQILTEQKEMREALRKVQEDTREVLIKVLKEQEATREMRDMLEMIKKKVFKEEEENSVQQGTSTVKEEIPVQQNTRTEEREEWIKLRNTLRRFNVSMDGIQAFQKFRFFCEPGHLPWPLPEEEED